MLRRSGSRVRLRRSVLAVLIGGWVGFGLLATATMLSLAAVADGNAAYAGAALLCLMLWIPQLIRSVSISGDVLVKRSLLLRDDCYPISEIVLVEVGMRREGPGFGSYVGYALAIETDSTRRILEPSRYCGRRRLDGWAGLMSQHDRFTGAVRSGHGNMRGNGPASALSAG